MAEIHYKNGASWTKITYADVGAAASVHKHAASDITSGTLSVPTTGNAGSATKLATARTINGTSFDGSANITTANWGTTRTITIGSTGKSVNGSGNVAWTLAEIGAAPASHTHTYAGSSSAGGAANSANVLNKNTKMDYSWNGLNYFNADLAAGNAAKANDAPSAAWWHILRFNHSNSSGYYTDLAVPFNKNTLHYKCIRNGSVANSGWVPILDKLNYTTYVTPASIGAASSGHTHSYLPLSGGTCTATINIKTSNINQASTSLTANAYSSGFLLQDKNGTRSGEMRLVQGTNGDIATEIGSIRVVSGSNKYNAIQIGLTNTGSPYYRLNSPSAFRSAIGITSGTGNPPASGTAGNIYIKYA